MIKLGDLCNFCGPRVTVIVRRGKLSQRDMQEVLFVGNSYDIPKEISEDYVLDISPAQADYLEVVLFDEETQKRFKS